MKYLTKIINFHKQNIKKEKLNFGLVLKKRKFNNKYTCGDMVSSKLT